MRTQSGRISIFYERLRRIENRDRPAALLLRLLAGATILTAFLVRGGSTVRRTFGLARRAPARRRPAALRVLGPRRVDRALARPQSAGACRSRLADVPEEVVGRPRSGGDVDGVAAHRRHKRPLTLDKAGARCRCSVPRRLAIATDYEGGDSIRADPTVPKDGLAIAGDAELLPSITSRCSSEDARRLIGLITGRFQRAGSARPRRRFTALDASVPAAQRAESFRSSSRRSTARTNARRAATWMTNYVEAVRRFPARPGDDGCGLITFVARLGARARGKKPVIDIGARITYLRSRRRVVHAAVRPAADLIASRTGCIRSRAGATSSTACRACERRRTCGR